MDTEADNRRVLAGCFCNLVRYASAKTHRDVKEVGASPDCFTVQAMAESLAAASNATAFRTRERSVGVLVDRAHERALTFQFTWKPPGKKQPYTAGFGLQYEEGDLKVRLLWLDVPERVPISPRLKPVDGREPLEEAVAERLQVLESGRLAPYPPPA